MSTAIKHGSLEWHEARRGKINISTAVNILYPGRPGVRGTPLTEYTRIVSELDGTDEPEEHDEGLADILHWGSSTEALHMSILQRKSPEWEITPNDKLVMHPDIDYICGTPDGFGSNTTLNRRAVVELKAPINFEPWGSECPTGPRTQCMLYASMCGGDMGMVSALIPPSVQVYVIPRDGMWEDWAWMMLKLFWTENVMKRVPPAATYDKDMEALKVRAREDGKSVLLPDSLREYAQRMEEAKRIIKTGEEMENEAKMKILDAMGDAETGLFADGSGYQFVSQTRKVPAREAGTSTYRVFRKVKK